MEMREEKRQRTYHLGDGQERAATSCGGGEERAAMAERG
jgi:hypothetical protein